MAFDAQAFLTGFFETTAENIKRKGIEARDFEKEEKRRAEGNKATISQRRARVQQVMGYTRFLRDNGATDDQLQAALSSGPEQIQVLAQKVQTAIKENNGAPLGAADMSTMIAMPKDFAPLKMDIDQYVQRTYGTYKDPNEPKAEAENISFWDRLTGDAAMKRVNEKLDGTPIYESFTAQDINEMAAQQEYKSLIPSTFAMVSDYLRFGSDQFEDSVTTSTRLASSLSNDPDYSSALETVEDQRGIVVNRATGELDKTSPQYETYVNALQTVKDMQENNFRSHYDGLFAKYGTQILTGSTNLKSQIERHMGKEYLDDLLDGLVDKSTGEAVSMDAMTPVSENSNVVEATNNTVKLQNPNIIDGTTVEFRMNAEGVITGATIGSDTLDLEAAQAAYSMFNSDKNKIPAAPNLNDMEKGSIPQIDSLSITRDQAQSMTRSQRKEAGLPESKLGILFEDFSTADGLARIEFKNSADPEKTYLVKVPGMNLNRPYKVNGSDLSYIPDNVLNKDYNNLTIKELSKEDDTEDFKSLSGSRLARMFNTEGTTTRVADPQKKIDLTEEEREQEEFEANNNPQGERKVFPKSVREKISKLTDTPMWKLEALQDSSEITEMDMSLVANSGSDMVEFLIKKEVKDSMDIIRALSEWADKNNKILPSGKLFLVETVGKRALKELENK